MEQLPFNETTYSRQTQMYGFRRRNIAIKTIPRGTYMFSYMNVPFQDADDWTPHQKQCHYIQYLLSQYINKTVRYNRDQNLFYICFSQEKPNGTFYYPCPGASFGVGGFGNTYNLAITSLTTRNTRIAYLKAGTDHDSHPDRIASRRANIAGDDSRIRQCNNIYSPCIDYGLPPPREPAARPGRNGTGPAYDPCLVGEYSRKARVDGWTSIAKIDSIGYFNMNEHELRQDAGDGSMRDSLLEQNVLSTAEFAQADPYRRRMGFLNMLGQDLIPLMVEATAHPELEERIIAGVPEYVIHGSGWRSFFSRARNPAGDHFQYGGIYPTAVQPGQGVPLTDSYGASVFSIRRDGANRLSTTYAIRPEYLTRFVEEYLTPYLLVRPRLFSTHIGGIGNMIQEAPLNLQPGIAHPEPNNEIRYQINRRIYRHLVDRTLIYDSLKNVLLRDLPNKMIYTLKINEKRRMNEPIEPIEWLQNYNDFCHPINFTDIYQAEQNSTNDSIRQRAILYKYNIVKLLKCALNCYKPLERYTIFGYGGHYNNIFPVYDLIKVPNGPFIEPWARTSFPTPVNPHGTISATYGMQRIMSLLNNIFPGISRIKDIFHDLTGQQNANPCLSLRLLDLPQPTRFAEARIDLWAAFNRYVDINNNHFVLQTAHDNHNYMYALAIIANEDQPLVQAAVAAENPILADWSVIPPGEPLDGTPRPDIGIWHGGQRKKYTKRNYGKKKNISRKKTHNDTRKN